MAYSAVNILLYLYSVFSPYHIAGYLSQFLPGQLNYLQLGLILALSVALLVGKRKMLNLLLLLFGGFEGYVASRSLMAYITFSSEIALILTLALAAAGAFLVYKLSRIAISAFLALTIGSMFIALGGVATTAPIATVAAFVVIYIFYKYVASVIAALLGSVLLLLFLVQLNIPGFTPYVISAAAFALSVLIRYAASRAGRERRRAIARPEKVRV